MRRPGTGLGFELGVNFNAAGEGGGMGASFSTSFSDINTGLFGVDTSQTGSGTQTSEATTIESIEVDEAGILKMIEDILGGTSGLAEIFSAGSKAGVFGSSAAKAGTEDLLAKIAGEIAKVTATKTTAQAGERATTSKTEAESSGIIDTVLGWF